MQDVELVFPGLMAVGAVHLFVRIARCKRAVPGDAKYQHEHVGRFAVVLMNHVVAAGPSGGVDRVNRGAETEGLKFQLNAPE